MGFVLSVIVAIVAFFGWRAAASKVKQNNLSFRAVATVLLLVCVFFAAGVCDPGVQRNPCGLRRCRGLLRYRAGAHAAAGHQSGEPDG